MFLLQWLYQMNFYFCLPSWNDFISKYFGLPTFLFFNFSLKFKCYIEFDSFIYLFSVNEPSKSKIQLSDTLRDRKQVTHSSKNLEETNSQNSNSVQRQIIWRNAIAISLFHVVTVVAFFLTFHKMKFWTMTWSKRTHFYNFHILTSNKNFCILIEKWFLRFFTLVFLEF